MKTVQRSFSNLEYAAKPKVTRGDRLLGEIDAAAREALKGDLVYVVVGDAAVVKPQLDGLGLPVEIAKPAN